MPNIDIDLNPVDFITIGTIGPKGQRVFHLQAAKGDRLITLIIEKEQAGALSEALRELIDDLDQRVPAPSGRSPMTNMELRDPVEPLFRVAQMGLGYDEEHDLVVLIAQELVPLGDEEDEEDQEDQEALDESENKPGVVRMWCSRAQMRALSEHSSQTVRQGRPDPKQNGRLIYYWT
ncbi:MAG: DUF3090 family protein [Chloroflexi bacterium]|nr:DUF3090 family protein [Chloroflexota bacterium]